MSEKAPRILVVEDEARLRGQVNELLERHGYLVDSAADGAEGLHLGSSFAFDLAVIDLGLPRLPGIDLIRELRRLGKVFPVIILTARGDWQNKVEGLQAGADDYLVKPFHVQELLARIQAQLRRASGRLGTELTLGSIVLDTRAKTVRVADRMIDVTAFEYRLLEYLMLHPGQVISKSELTDHLYDQDYDRDSNVIEVFVGRLRRKLDPDNLTRPIETIRGQGYRIGTGA